MKKASFPGSRRWRKEFGALDRPQVWYPIKGGHFPTEADEERGRLWAYAEVILETAAQHGLSMVHAKKAGWFRYTVVSGAEAQTVLDDARGYQEGSTQWQLGDVAWSDPGLSNVLVHIGDPDGWWPTFSAWGPKAKLVFDDIDGGWSWLSKSDPVEP